MGYLSESKKNESVMPTFKDILVAHSTLGDLLHNHFSGNTPPPAAMNEAMNKVNKLGIVAGQPLRK
jgi:hypothetical protein